MSHVINSRALTGEMPCINKDKAIHALLMHGYATFNMLIAGHRIAAVTSCVLPCPRTSIVRGNSVRATSVKRRNIIVQDITQNVANVFNFYAVIAIEHGFSMHYYSPGPLGGVENRGLGFQHLPWDLANVNA